MYNFVFNVQNIVTILASLFFVIYFVLKYANSSRKFHPGPTGLPLIGYLGIFSLNLHLKFAELIKQYGEVFSFRCGLTHFVILGSYDAVKEAFMDYDELIARPYNMFRMQVLEKWPGMVSNHGHSWTQIRRFSLTVLRNFGFGKSSMEPKIQDEIGFMLELLNQTDGQPINILDSLHLSTTNTVCTILFGQRFDYKDKIFKELLEDANDYINDYSFNDKKLFIPSFFIKLFGIKDSDYYGTRTRDALAEIIKQRIKSHIPGTDDSFINIWFDEQNKPNVDTKSFNDEMLASVLWDLFMAAADTTSMVLHWILLYMAKYPEVQTKVQKEIDEIIGRDRTPSMVDQNQMTFTEAVINEVYRITVMPVFLLPRRALSDITFRGYIIPKGATVMTNLWSIHHNPKIFPEPEKFRPERFLNEENKIIKQNELLPFGIGKRNCIGESLGRMNVFLYLASILQNFFLKPLDIVDLTPDLTFFLQPKPQQLRLIRR